MQSRDLISAQDEDFSVHDLQSQRLMQAGGMAFPSYFAQAGVQSADQPDFTGHRADGGGTVFEEIQPTDEEQGAVGVFERDPDAIDRERPAVPDRALRLETSGPAGRPAMGQ